MCDANTKLVSCTSAGLFCWLHLCDSSWYFQQVTANIVIYIYFFGIVSKSHFLLNLFQPRATNWTSLCSTIARTHAGWKHKTRRAYTYSFPPTGGCLGLKHKLGLSVRKATCCATHKEIRYGCVQWIIVETERGKGGEGGRQGQREWVTQRGRQAASSLSRCWTLGNARMKTDLI